MTRAAALVGDPITVEVPGLGSICVRSPSLLDFADGTRDEGIAETAVRILAACVVDDDGEAVLSTTHARAWVLAQTVERLLEVVAVVGEAAGMSAGDARLVEWLEERPVLRLAVKLARRDGRDIREILALPLGHVRLMEADAMLEAMEGKA